VARDARVCHYHSPADWEWVTTSATEELCVVQMVDTGWYRSHYVWPHWYVSVDKYAKVLDNGCMRNEIGTNTKQWLQQLMYRQRLVLDQKLWSLLRSSGSGLNASAQQHNWYILRDGSVATAFCSGHIIRQSMYRQHKDANEDRGSLSSSVVYSRNSIDSVLRTSQVDYPNSGN